VAAQKVLWQELMALLPREALLESLRLTHWCQKAREASCQVGAQKVVWPELMATLPLEALLKPVRRILLVFAVALRQTSQSLAATRLLRVEAALQVAVEHPVPMAS